MSAERWPFARSPVGPSQLQLWDVKTLGVKILGVLPKYQGNFSVPPADQRARPVPRDKQKKAIECDRGWNGMTTGLVGAFKGCLSLLAAVIGLGFRGC